MPDTLPVSKRAREAAADTYVADHPKREETALTFAIRNGSMDRNSRVQAFANFEREITQSTADHVAELEAENARLRDDARSLVVNSPETADFMAGVPLEAAHQRDRWGVDHDAGKTPFDWFWLVGYLAQKAASSAVAGNTEKARHHTISTAAALANWHAALIGADTRMRPGIEPPAMIVATSPMKGEDR